jgi:hypothetical protein
LHAGATGRIFTLYPNPAADRLYLKGIPKEGEHLAAVYDVFGRMVVSTRLGQENSGLDIHSLPPGLYVVMLKSSDNVLVLWTAKFVKTDR